MNPFLSRISSASCHREVQCLGARLVGFVLKILDFFLFQLLDELAGELVLHGSFGDLHSGVHRLVTSEPDRA